MPLALSEEVLPVLPEAETPAFPAAVPFEDAGLEVPDAAGFADPAAAADAALLADAEVPAALLPVLEEAVPAEAGFPEEALLPFPFTPVVKSLSSMSRSSKISSSSI